MGRRRRLRPDRWGTALPRGGHGRPASQGHRAVNVGPNRREAGRRRAGLDQAVGRGDPPNDRSLAFHDGQGPRCTSRAFQRRLESHGVAQSMPRPGNPRDNAVAESLFKTSKRELIKERPCRTRGGCEAGGLQAHRAALQHPENALIAGPSGALRLRARRNPEVLK